MKDARVSIIVPMYNASKYIIETLESVRRQTYTDWELIIVNDCSNDSSVEIVQEYMSQHKGIGLLLSQPQDKNRGTSASRNLGLEYARGRLLCFLDADDVWNHDFLDSFIQVFDNYPGVSMAYCPALLWDMSKGNAKDKIQRLGIKPSGIVDPLFLFKLFLNGKADTPSPSGVMMNKELFFKVGKWEEKFHGMYDDQVMYTKLLLNGATVYVIDKCLYKYRQHDESICHRAIKENKEVECRKMYLEWLQRYLIEIDNLSETFYIVLLEQLWYVQRKKEITLLPSNGWWFKIGNGLRSLIMFSLKQNDIKFAIKFISCIVLHQILHTIHKSRSSDI